MQRHSTLRRTCFASTTAVTGTSPGFIAGLLVSCCAIAFSLPASAQGVAVSDPACPANPGAAVDNGGADGVAVSGAADCPPGITPAAEVNDEGGIAIGNDRTNPTITAGDGNSIAIGNGARGGTTGSSNAVALGTGAAAISTGSVAIGRGAVAGSLTDLTRVNQVAIGNNAAATAQNSTAIGDGSIANGPQSTAIGSAASAGTNSTATGRSSIAGNSAVAYGVNANAGLRGTALGQGATATAVDSTAVGSFASSTVANSVALGRNSVASRGAQASYTGYGLVTPQTSVGEVSIGTAAGQRQLTGVAAGSAATDAVNVSQLTAIDGQSDLLGSNVATALGGGASYDAATGALTAPTYSVQGGSQTNAGTALTALDTQVTANTAGIATNTGDIATNTANIATNTADIATNTADIDDLETAVGNGTVGLVQQSAAGSDLTVGAATDGAAVNFAGTGGDRRLTGVVAGAVSAASNEAVNGSQLFAGSTSIVTALGGGASVNPDGTVAAPTYTVQGTTQTNVGGALTALDTQVTTSSGDIATNTGDIATNTANIATNTGDIADLTAGIGNGTVGLVQQAAAGADLTVGAATDGAAVSFAGTGGDRTLTGVAAGAVSAASNEAVNGSQLFAGNTSIAGALGGGASVNPDGSIAAPSYTIQGATQANVGGALTALDTQMTTNTAGIADNAADIVTNTSNIASNTSNIATNTANIATNTTDIDDLETAVGNGTIGLVQQAAAGADLTVGAATDGAAVSFAGTGGDRTLTGVAAGAVSAASNDAVNGSQLFAGSTSIATALGGGASVNPDGTVAGPNYTVQGATRADVGGALTALDTQMTTNTTNIATNTGDIADLAAGIGSGSVGLVRQSAAGADLTVGAATDGAAVSFAGTGGDRRLTGVAAGAVSAASNEAVNGSQLFAGSTSIADALGGGANVNPDGTVAAPSYAIQGAAQSTVGAAFAALDTQVTTNTAGITANGADIATNTGDIATNTANIATNTADIATNTADIGDLETAVGNGTVGLVQQSAAGSDLTVGAATDGAAVNFAGTGGDRRLTGVAAGAVSAASSDAVNGSQLFAGNTSIATALGGGARVNADGTVAAPTYTVQGTTQTNVGGALTALDTQVTTNTTNIATNTGDIADLAAGIGDGTVGLVRQAAAGADLTVGAATDGTAVNFAGTGGDRNLTGVAAGAVSAASNQAINGSQLFAGNASLASALGGGASVNPDGTVTAPNYTVQGATQTSVGGALTALDTQVTTNSGDIADLASAIGSGSVGLVQQADPAAQVTVAAATGGSSVNFAGTTGNRVLTGVANGAVAAGSAEAINGGQLAGTAQSVATALGGGAMVTADGNVSAPAYAVQGATQTSVGGALTALDTQVTSNTTAIAGLENDVAGLSDAVASGTVGLVQQAAAGAPLTVGAETDGAAVDFAGTAGNRTLTGVSAGALSNTSSDAVNGSQLNATNLAIRNVADLVTSQGGGFSSDNSAGAAVPLASGADSSAGGNGAVASGQQSTAVGNNAVATGARATVVGYAASATGANSVAIGAGSSDEGEDNVVSVGSADAGRRVTNVAMGVNQTDAVNVGQLSSSMGQTLNAANAYTDTRFNGLSFDIDEVRRDGEGATAASMALAGIPQSFERGVGMVGMGVGTWQGESAIALGISKATDSGRVVFKAGATYSTRGQGGANGGVGLAF